MKFFNLLPEEQEKFIRKEYRLRLIVVLLMMFFTTGLVILVFLLPSFLIITLRHSDTSSNLRNLEKNTPELLKAGELESALSQINLKLNILEPQKITLPSEVLGDIFSDGLSGISINSFSYNLNEKQADLKITGQADNREALTNFVRGLREKDNFSDVNLPVSDLAGDRDLSFSVTFAVYF